MRAETETPNGADRLFEPYIDFWSSCFEQTSEATRQIFETAGGDNDPRTWQRRWLEAVSRSTDAFLRSPMFLGAMKRNMDAAVRIKMQADDVQKEFARNANIPTAGDISGLFERLRSIEKLILMRLGHIEERLDTIESKLPTETTSNGKKSSAPRKKTKRK